MGFSNMINALQTLHSLTRRHPREASYDDREWYERLWRVYRDRSGWTRLRLAHVERMVAPKRGDRVLDLGCASGAIADFCAQRGATVVGVDSSPIAVDCARHHCPRATCTFHVADVCNLRFIASNSLDKAVAADLVEHLQPGTFHAMLAEAKRVLKPDGTLSIYTPNAEHLIERLKARDIVLRQNVSHIAVMRPAEVRDALHRAGFAIDLAYTTTSHFPIFRRVESLMRHVSGIGPLFRYRICVRGRKVES